MAKYLAKANFTTEGLAGLRAAGAASRVAAGHALAASVGGTLEAYYFAFGDVDAGGPSGPSSARDPDFRLAGVATIRLTSHDRILGTHRDVAVISNLLGACRAAVEVTSDVCPGGGLIPPRLGRRQRQPAHHHRRCRQTEWHVHRQRYRRGHRA